MSVKFRLPHDGSDEVASLAAISVMPEGEAARKEDKTRQELKAETDLNILLNRYQPFELPARETFSGERFYDRDMHDDMIAARRAFEVWAANDAARSSMSFEDFLRKVPDEGFAAPAAEPSAGTDQPSEGEGGSAAVTQ